MFVLVVDVVAGVCWGGGGGGGEGVCMCMSAPGTGLVPGWKAANVQSGRSRRGRDSERRGSHRYLTDI